MDCSKQKRHAVFLYRSAMAFLVFFFATPFAYSQLSHSFGQIPVGNSDTNGFVRVDKVFYSLSLGNGRNAELFFKFSSDPCQEPKYLGAYWAIPFFDSNIIKLSTNRYRWVAPNLRTYTFNKEQKADRGYKETYILNTTGKLKLNVAKDGSICIENVDDLKNRYLFKNGRLVSFCEGKDADTFKISYETGSRPSSVYNVGKNSTEIKFAYNKDGFLAKIVFPRDKKALFIAYGECDTLAEDGITKQGKLLKSISSITFADGKKEEYKYSAETNKKSRAILVKREKNEEERIYQDVNLNEIEQRIEGHSECEYIKWDAITGIIVSDSAGNYAIRNPLFDKYNPEWNNAIFQDYRRKKLSSQEVSIRYKKPEFEYDELWEYNVSKAIKITQNPLTGEQVRMFYIGSSGGASMKVRKIEKKLIGCKDWITTTTKIYNEDGLIVREILSGNRVKEFRYEPGIEKQFIDGKPFKFIIRKNNSTAVSVFSDNGKKVVELKESPDRIEQSDYSKNYGIYTLYDKNAEIYLKRVYGGIYDILEETSEGYVRRIKLKPNQKELRFYYDNDMIMKSSNKYKSTKSNQ